MKIYGYEDNYIEIEKEKGMYIVYNSYSNKVIALNKKGYSLLKQLVSEGKKIMELLTEVMRKQKNLYIF